MKFRIHFILLCTAAIVIAMAAHAWLAARRDSENLAATLASQNAVIQRVRDRQKQRDAELAADLASIQSEKRAVHNPQQAAKHLPDALPPLPLPLSIRVPSLSAARPSDEPFQTTIEPYQTTISIPTPDLIPLYDNLQDCRAAEVQTDTLEKDLADEKARSAALLREREAAVTAAHGGTLFSRIKRASKWFAIGLATGAAIAATLHP